MAGHHVLWQVLAADSQHLVRRDFGARPGGDEERDRLPSLVVWDADRGHRDKLLHPEGRRLDLLAGDAVAPRLDEVVPAVNDGDVSVVVHDGQVPGAQPVRRELGEGALGIVEIARGDVRAGRVDLTPLARLDRLLRSRPAPAARRQGYRCRWSRVWSKLGRGQVDSRAVASVCPYMTNNSAAAAVASSSSTSTAEASRLPAESAAVTAAPVAGTCWPAGAVGRGGHPGQNGALLPLEQVKGRLREDERIAEDERPPHRRCVCMSEAP